MMQFGQGIEAEHRASGTRTTLPHSSIDSITFPYRADGLHVEPLANNTFNTII